MSVLHRERTEGMRIIERGPEIGDVELQVGARACEAGIVEQLAKFMCRPLGESGRLDLLGTLTAC